MSDNIQYYPYNSRNSLYRSKIGAVASGETLKLRLLLHKDACCNNVYFLYREDSGQVQEHLMTPCEWLYDYRFYEIEVSLPEGLYWYSFRYTSLYGDFNIVKVDGGLGIVSREGGNWWQQTVYDAAFKTPDWLKGGVIYQIFPDRFYKSGKPHKKGLGDRYDCEDITLQPAFKQDNTPRRLGNDFYGGDLEGICEKLPYIASLGVNCIYLNPIFKARSNHRYDTGDYMQIDEYLGDEDDLRRLCEKAGELGIHIILDGVFSHTGDDSRYFNRYNSFEEIGAYNSTNSKYSSWYTFEAFPNKYNCWWGVPSLPEVNEENPQFLEFITGENGVLKKWLRCGIKGWRLDVADELPDAFLDALRVSVKSEDEDNYILGEVWEDASHKISYGYRRRFLRGKQLDSVMNYPFANAIVDFTKGGNAHTFNETVCSILENYPKCSIDLLMNHIGTHDTARILTRLGRDDNYVGDRQWQSEQSLSDWEYERGVKRLKFAALLQYTLPGVPSLYYGDEAGLQGFGDPFCRAAFNWENINDELLQFYRNLGKMRTDNPVFKEGEYIPLVAEDGLLAFIRKSSDKQLLVALNRNEYDIEFTVPEDLKNGTILFGQYSGEEKASIKPMEFLVIAN